MPQIANDRVSLDISEDGARVLMRDLARKAQWKLESPLVAEGEIEGPRATGPGRAWREGEGLMVSYPLAQGEVRYRWRLGADHVEVTLESDSPPIGPLPLPGMFSPESGPREIALPLYQGLLMRASGRNWSKTARHGGHIGFAMSMGVIFGGSSGLLLAHESPVNWTAAYGESADGPFFYFLQQRCPVEAWRGASVRIYPVDKGLTAACKTYRRLVQERGEFVSWEQKIQQRPRVENLFGALMAFVGYNKAPEIDYASGARRLREYGFEKVLYYPLRMCHYSLDFKMGGDDPIWLSDEQLNAVKAVEGAMAGPWGWCFEGLDDGSAAMRGIFRHDQKGPVAAWKIDDYQWYQVCVPYQIEHMKKRFSSDMKMMDWVHHDVSACVPGSCCFAGHASHGGAPMSAREDVLWTQRLFDVSTVGNRIVASEGFTDHNTPWYDIGSTKMMPPLGESGCFVPVPMTMLVYHDSCAHAWWEAHNYNVMPGDSSGTGPIESFPRADLPEGIGSAGAGSPRLKAAIDALYGSAPHVFPFGRQYGWRDFARRLTYSYSIRLDDAAVQEALVAALPVARLHQRIGRLEMAQHEMLSEDRYVQSTVFSDGTRIIANLARGPREAGRWGMIEGESWREAGR